ncbi:uncharacterized protein NEPG_00040 [Nematocida parisii ERTm1]|uniref:Rho-GAP domain-containing protein n=1 Tax=Nematocida parisii (strain ERTm3) TaxID=935791 RepID=I3EDZ1_NEMP3|nr:uncharacterized protein NEPG_00040 [Nematocida parisii ERTm1]EIJ87438.1 hypothetical protein NEQG_02319 [Nematocida parisii ERTm3]EIJ94518.1 hypothetical protein NEPG_00040 [Nematocida parisii ERTm1]|eukprot:XP_013057874.1 hypothetical protein NEPG_00040 [Nematocida parisii ERTm1]
MRNFMSNYITRTVHSEEITKIFNRVTKLFPHFKLGARHLICTHRSRQQSFSDMLDRAIFCGLKGSMEHPRTKVYVLANLARDILAYFIILCADEQNTVRGEFQAIYRVIESRASALVGDFSRDFFENLMNNVFGVGKHTLKDSSNISTIKRRANVITHWPMRLFRRTSHTNTSVQDMTYSDILKDFHFAIYQSKDSILTGQDTGAWSMVRELYTRTMERAGETPSSMKEVSFILQVDRACRDYSPPLLIGGGIVGGLRVIRKKYFENVVELACSDTKGYPIRELLKDAKVYMYAPLIQGIINVLTTCGATKEDILPYTRLLSAEADELFNLPEEKQKRAEAILLESIKICDEVIAAMGKSPSRERELKIIRGEIMMINKILLGSKLVLPQKVTPEQEIVIDALVEECARVWERFMGTGSKPSNSAYSKKAHAEFPYFSKVYKTVAQPEEIADIAMEGLETANISESAAVEKQEKPAEPAEPSFTASTLDLPESVSSTPAEACVEEAASPNDVSANIPSVIRTISSAPLVKKASPSSSIFSTPVSGGVGQSPKEQPCSDMRCKVYSVGEEDQHLKKLSAAIDVQEESEKRGKRIDELRQYFGGLKYACFYSRNVPDHLKNLFKCAPSIYNKVKRLYDRNFTDVLAVEEIRVCRRSMFRDAYSEILNARPDSEILMHLRDDIIVTKYMDMLKERTIEKLIALEREKKEKELHKAREKPKLKGVKRLMKKVSSAFESFFKKQEVLPSVEEELHNWEVSRREEMDSEVIFTKNSSQRVSHGFLNVSKALVDLIKYTPGYVYRKTPETVDVTEKYAAWIDREEPVDYEEIKKNPDQLRALSMVFNRYIRNYNGGVVSKYLYVAIAERAGKVPLEKVDYGMGLMMLATMGSNTLWLLKHVVYTVEQVAKYEETNFMSYQSIVNIVAPNLLADDVPYSMDTFVIVLEMAHSLFAATRNISFMEEFYA